MSSEESKRAGAHSRAESEDRHYICGCKNWYVSDGLLSSTCHPSEAGQDIVL
jgi:hypothetical protein